MHLEFISSVLCWRHFKIISFSEAKDPPALSKVARSRRGILATPPDVEGDVGFRQPPESHPADVRQPDSRSKTSRNSGRFRPVCVEVLWRVLEHRERLRRMSN